MPEDAEPPSRHPGPGTPRRARRRIDAVLFDFHGTLAQVEDAIDWVRHAALTCGVTLEPPRAAWLADRLIMAGRAGGPPPVRVPPHLAEVFADRDLSGPAHRATYAGLAATVDSGIEGLPEALYERILDPTGWTVYPETVPTLAALYEAEVPVAVVSNIGFDVRPMLDAWGATDLVAACALSYEVGRCKPDPAIFRHACALLGVEPERTLMVGDSPADAGAVAAGCVALILPAPPAGQPHGLAAALDLAGVA